MDVSISGTTPFRDMLRIRQGVGVLSRNTPKEAEQRRKSGSCTGHGGRVLKSVEPVAFLLRKIRAKFAQLSCLPPLPQAVLREDV
jgi:hypothetical protein